MAKKKYVYVEPNDYIPKELYEKYFGKEEEEQEEEKKKTEKKETKKKQSK